MGILDKVVKIEKRIEKLASRRDAATTAIEIRRAILDDVEEQVKPAGRSRKVFPYDRVTIEVLAGGERREAGAGATPEGPRPPERAELEAVLGADDLTGAIRERLQEAGCERVGRLQVSVKVIRKARPDWRGAMFAVGYERTEEANAAAARTALVPPERKRGPSAGAEPAAREVTPGATSPPRAAQIVILEGNATKKAYTLAGERTNIGRLAEVTDKHHRVVRRNQVIFVDADSEANETVSRAQAHITFAPPDDYRLYDDNSSYGTRVLRDGRLIELPSGSPRGVKLRAGDEIHFGRARVAFQIK